MSAHILSDVNIDYILSNISWGRNPELIRTKEHLINLADKNDIQKLGQILVDENYRSVNHRYNKTDLPHDYEFKHSHRFVNFKNHTLQALMLLNSYEYQACECNDYVTSCASGLVRVIRNILINNLPGYSECEWDFDSKRDVIDIQDAESYLIKMSIEAQQIKRLTT